MSDLQERADDPSDDNDERLIELLDRYVDTLHDANDASRSELLSHHAELADFLGCLNALDSLAISQKPGFSKKPDFSNDVPLPELPLSQQPTLIEPSGRPPPTGDGTPHAVLPGGGVVQEFGKYRLEAEIGRGGMGVVYRARQTDLDRVVAVKMILSSRLASRDEVQRFYAEAKAAAAVRHPNIVGIHEVGQVHGQHYFAMDYVAGQSLAQLLRGGPMASDKAAECVVLVARAVHFLHEHNIVHRDLKPSNILVDEDGIPYVTDFGLAKVFSGDSAHTQTGTIVGTPSYMSPEQAAGRSADISPQSDVYSLGAILYELLCGRPPFRERTPLDTLVQVLEGEPTIITRVNPLVPRELELICLRCLEKDPRNRYASAAELADDLERHLRREPIQAQPPGVFHAVRRWVRREPALVFGRENHGLDRTELALCDLTVQVPTSPEHPVLNLSHAVGILLYELFTRGVFQRPCRRAGSSSSRRRRRCRRRTSILSYPSYASMAQSTPIKGFILSGRQQGREASQAAASRSRAAARPAPVAAGRAGRSPQWRGQAGKGHSRHSATPPAAPRPPA